VSSPLKPRREHRNGTLAGAADRLAADQLDQAVL
jgi:hypothetical protein